MPYHDDTDRYCPHCHGKRFFTDTHTHDYGYTARSLTRCTYCAPAIEPEAPHVGPDALMDAALARLAANAGMGVADFRAQMFGVAV